MVHMDETALSRQFRRATGSTFTTFFTELRVAKAWQMLLHTNREISSICYEVDFNNISNFNRHFLRRRGATPSQYWAGQRPGVDRILKT
ncbi:helix-turn-helix domain-containing protein [Delftia lacustris]|uniref:helix-turn-helix domain-containing protein n=1 Tax=Delftia lacustris TaxID=558537 RepID=UPI0035A6C20B